MVLRAGCVVVLLCATFASIDAADKPNVIFVAVDDLGWNDVGWQNPDMITPNMDSLAKEGIILDQYYVQPVCTPSRSAWMTGFYPYRLGLQHLVIMPNQSTCVPADKTFMPQVLQKNGYSTHALGKWHLGFCKWECTPTYRGFDTFMGYYNGAEDHYTKQIGGFYDFRDQKDFVKNGTYSSYMIGDRMERIISTSNNSKPLFMYLAFQNVHMPMQVPKKYEDMYSHIKNANRRVLSAMVTAVDDVIGRLINSLKQKGIYDNTLIVFSSDNGGWTTFGGNNYPLRGGKVSIFEGGTRVAGFVHGKMLNKTTNRFTGLMHAVDWFPTILDAAGISYQDPNMDGMSQWAAINNRQNGTRNEIIYNMDYGPQPIQGRAAIRQGDYKLIDGFPGVYIGWVKPDTLDDTLNDTLGDTTLRYTGPDFDYNQLHTQFPAPNITFFKALYNLKDDPTEHNNLYHTQPEIAKKLEARLEEVKARTYIPPNYPAGNPNSDPNKYGGVWTPGWC